jgi:hypothetical protein
MSTWFNSVDIYCERLDASFWTEPINAISNLSFIVAGFFIWRLRSPRSALMAILMILIGLGSFSFHTYANRLTGLLDVLAIALYLVAFAFLIPKQWSRNSPLIQMGSVFLLIVYFSLLTNGSLKARDTMDAPRHLFRRLVGTIYICFGDPILECFSSSIFMAGGDRFSIFTTNSSTGYALM